MIELKHLYEQKRGYYITDLSAERCLVGFSPNNVDFVTYIVHNLVPLEVEEVNKIILEALEQCKQICREIKIIAKGGLVNTFDNTYCFQGVYVYDYQYLDDLRSERFIELFAHNEFVYGKIKKHFNNNRFGAIVQATGTGKSYLIARYISEVSIHDRIIVLVPNRIISDEIKKALECEYANVEFFTFQGLSRKNITQLKAAHIIIDEFHHSESEVWGGSIKGLIRNNPDARVFGTTATPVRPSDDVNVVDTLFKGKLINELNLSTTIHAGILPCPKIIQSIYNIKSVIDDYYKEFNLKKKHLLRKQKEDIGMTLNQMMKNIETFSVASLLAKHIDKNRGKFLVFCSSIEELRNMRSTVKVWFEAAGFQNIDIYTVHSEKHINKNKDVIESFQMERNSISLLFSVDMLSEGMHLHNIDGAIFLRKTSSYIVCLQQLGRTLKAGQYKNKPIILDLVNNIDSGGFIKNNIGDVVYPAGQSYTNSSIGELEIDIEDMLITDVVAKLKDIEEIWSFENISWNRQYNKLKEYIETYHCYPNNESDKSLAQWCTVQRRRYRQGSLLQSRIDMLNLIDINWNTITDWDEIFEELKSVLSRREECILSKELISWSYYQRKAYKAGVLSQDKIEKLNSINFSWKDRKNWEEIFEELKAFLSENNGIYPTRETNNKLYNWCVKQRIKYTKAELSEKYIITLNSIGFIWKSTQGFDHKWMSAFENLRKYLSENNGIYPTKETNNKLYNWCVKQRIAYNDNLLSSERMMMLEDIKFTFILEDQWMKRFEELKKYIGDECSYPSFTDNKSLGTWCSTQRRYYKTGVLSQDKIEKLNSINFSWKDRKNWEEIFEELKAFLSENNGIYPTRETNNKLYKWCVRHKTGVLSQDKIEKLNSINFSWKDRK